MKELAVRERIRRMTREASVEHGAIAPIEEDRGEALCRACLGAQQLADAREDGAALRFRQEPPAADYRALWLRLNHQWREQRRT